MREAEVNRELCRFFFGKLVRNGGCRRLAHGAAVDFAGAVPMRDAQWQTLQATGNGCSSRAQFIPGDLQATNGSDSGSRLIEMTIDSRLQGCENQFVAAQ